MRREPSPLQVLRSESIDLVSLQVDDYLDDEGNLNCQSGEIATLLSECDRAKIHATISISGDAWKARPNSLLELAKICDWWKQLADSCKGVRGTFKLLGNVGGIGDSNDPWLNSLYQQCVDEIAKIDPHRKIIISPNRNAADKLDSLIIPRWHQVTVAVDVESLGELMQAKDWAERTKTAVLTVEECPRAVAVAA